MNNTPPDKRLLSVVGNLRQSIDGLRRIHDRWRGSNESLINLIAQLTALKSNLATMLDWLEYAIYDLHPQLLSDLNYLLSSCNLLVRHLDDVIARLGQPDRDAMDFASRLKYAVGTLSMERLRKVTQRQNDSVGLLLAACKW